MSGRVGTKQRVGDTLYTARKRSKSNAAKAKYARPNGRAKARRYRVGTSGKGKGRIILSKVTRDFLTVYGNPFLKTDTGNAPRCSDPENVECTAGYYYSYDMPAAAGADGNGLLLVPSMPFAIGGMADWLSTTQPLAAVALPPVDACTSAAEVNARHVTARGLLREQVEMMIAEGSPIDQNSKRMREIYKQFTRHRFVGSGVRLHDLGTADTQQGELKAKQVKSDDFYRYVRQAVDALVQQQVSPERAQMQLYQMGGTVVPFIIKLAAQGSADPVVAGLGLNGLTAEWARAIVEQAVTECKEQNGDNGFSYILAEGITQRAYIRQAARPFVRKPHNVILPADTNGVGNCRALDPRSVSKINQYFGGKQNCVYTQNNLADGRNYFTLEWAPGILADATNFAANPHLPNNVSLRPFSPLLCTDTGEVYDAVQEDDWDNMQGDAGLMVFQFQTVGASRPLRLERSFYGEAIVSGNSIMAGTMSPYDAGFQHAIGLSNAWPYVKSGFSFWSSIWHGIKEAASFAVNHIEDATKIVTAGATLAKAFA